MDQQQRMVEQFTWQVDRFVTSPHVNQETIVRRFLDLLGTRPDESALDVACGPGLLARSLEPRVASVTGVDLTPAMVEKAREIVPGGRFVVGDATRLPFPDGSFDLVVTRLSLHHMPDPLAVVREMARVTRRTVGIFDLVTSEVPEEDAFHNRVEVLRDPTHTRGLAPSELIRLVGLAGLHLQRVDTAEIELDVDDWIARADQPQADAREVRRLMEEAVGTRRLGGRLVRRDGEGRLWFGVHYVMLAAEKR